MTLVIDPKTETTKEGDVKTGQSFEIRVVTTPGEAWKLASYGRSLGPASPTAIFGATAFRWSATSALQSGDHQLVFSNGSSTLTVTVHVK